MNPAIAKELRIVALQTASEMTDPRSGYMVDINSIPRSALSLEEEMNLLNNRMIYSTPTNGVTNDPIDLLLERADKIYNWLIKLD